MESCSRMTSSETEALPLCQHKPTKTLTFHAMWALQLMDKEIALDFPGKQARIVSAVLCKAVKKPESVGLLQTF